MCNFVIRNIKSYATVDVDVVVTNGQKTIKRGEVVTVSKLSDGHVVVYLGDTAVGPTVKIPLTTFTHAFTANTADIKKVKDEEAKWFK